MTTDDRWRCDAISGINRRCIRKAKFHVRGGPNVIGTCGVHLSSYVTEFSDQWGAVVIKPFGGIRETI